MNDLPSAAGEDGIVVEVGVPGDQAAGRIPDAVVRTELAYQRAQRAKKDAEEALRRGDARVAQRLYGNAALDIAAAAPAAPAAARPELEQEAQVLDDLALRAIENGNWAMKASTADHDLKSRKRGRRREA